MFEQRLLMLTAFVLLACLLPSVIALLNPNCTCAFPERLTGTVTVIQLGRRRNAVESGSFWVDFHEGHFRALMRNRRSGSSQWVFVDMNTDTWFYNDSSDCPIQREARFSLLPACVPSADMGVVLECAANGNQRYLRGDISADGYADFEVRLGCAICVPQMITLRDRILSRSRITEYSDLERWDCNARHDHP